jgi:isovaleryl-CoA dehydrogenase
MSFKEAWTTYDLYNPSDEHAMLRRSIKAFTEKEVEPQAEDYNNREAFNIKLFRKLGPLGLLGITAPSENGGSELDALAAVIAHEELSASDPAFALAYLAHSMLCVNNISVNGNESQRKAFLPKLCSGEWIGAMGLSEPSAGTDVLSMTTSARRDGDSFVINGRKLWITNGTVDDAGTPCDCLLLYAASEKPEGSRPKISTFIVRATDQGFSVGQKIRNKLGMRASTTAELCFDNCRLPLDRLVGNEGEALTHMMRNLELERVTLAAMALGIARRSIDIMCKYADERKAFGKKIHSFGQIQAHIANSYAEYNSARAYVYDTARCLDLDKPGNRLASDAVKLVAAPMAKRVADRAIQVLGGFGYVGEYKVERLWRDAKLLEIGGGTNEAHQKNIASDLIRNL